MPRALRKEIENPSNWIAAGVATVRFGILTGYALRGQTASLATNVEHQLNVSAARVRRLERPPQFLEAKGGVDNTAALAEKIARAY